MIKQEIISALKKVLDELGLKGVEPMLEVPSEASHGDYSSNVALVAFGRVKGKGERVKWKTPMELAKEIIKPFTLDPKPYLDKVEVAKPAFINFWLSKEYLVSSIIRIIEEKDKFGHSDILKNQKIMVEFADPNPFKEFHIGHLRNISLGESFARLLEAQGANVWRVNYQGDVGLHVAKALYGLLQIANSKSQIEKIDKESLSEKVKLLGQCYVVGDRAHSENDEVKREIQALNMKIYRNDPSVRDIWEKGRAWSLNYFEAIYKRLGTKYRRYYFESEVAGPGRQIVLSHIDDGIFEKHDGAVVFRGERQGLHTRVFVTKEDYATYEAKDLGLAEIKYKDFLYDKSIIITAPEQTPYFKVVLSAMRQVFPDLAVKTIHYPFGFVSLKEGKMSSRTGKVATAEWLLDEAKRRIKKQFSEMDEKTAEKVAVGAVKYSMLKFSTASDISFSFEESISLEGNSGPYLQYTFARTQSVLHKAKISNFQRPITNFQFEPEELVLLRMLPRFPEVVEEAAKKFAPNIVCDYLFTLAQAFNLFYQKNPIIRGGEKKEFRLVLTATIGQILKSGLNLLGIATPQRM